MSKEIHAKNFIGGKFCDPVSGLRLDIINPATTDAFGSIPDSNEDDVQLAVKAAVISNLLQTTAFETWSLKSATCKSSILLKIAALIEARSEEFAYFESRDQGKPITLARTVDIPRAIHNFRFFATSILHQDTQCTQTEGILNYVTKQPVGVCALISPWNLPLYLLTWKVSFCKL